MSKPVFAYLLLKLVERGEFELDRPLVKSDGSYAYFAGDAFPGVLRAYGVTLA